MLSFFPRDVLEEIWDLIESVFLGFFFLLFQIAKGIIKTAVKRKGYTGDKIERTGLDFLPE